MTLTTLPLRNLRNHGVRSLLTASGVAIALACMLALIGFSRGLDRTVMLFLEGKGTHILALQKGSIEILTAALDENLATQISTVDGVTSVMAGLGELVELETGQMAFIAGWPADSDFWRTLEITRGSRPDPRDTGSIVLGQSLAELLGKQPGETLELGGRPFTITAISRQASVLDDRSVMMPMAALQQLLGREGKASGFHIRVDHPEDAARLAGVKLRLSAAFPELTFVESGEVVQNAHVVRLLRAMSWASTTVALVMAVVFVLNTLLMSVTERAKEIGILAAIGWQRSRVLALIVAEGILLALAGSVLGLIAGWLGLQWMIRHPLIGGLLQPEVTPMLMVQAVGLAVLVGTLGGLYPAWRATRLQPMELLRGE